MTKSSYHLRNRIANKKKRKEYDTMKNYMRTMVENYFVKNLVALKSVANENDPAEVLSRNSYTLLNVSPRFF